MNKKDKRLKIAGLLGRTLGYATAVFLITVLLYIVIHWVIIPFNNSHSYLETIMTMWFFFWILRGK